MKIAALFILLPLQIFAQDFTGAWKGFLYTQGNEVPYELVISQDNNKLKGYSLTVFAINAVENIGIKSMKVKSRKTELSIEDDDLIYNNYTTPGKRVTLYSTLTLEKKDSILILQGSFFTRATDRSSFRGTIRLEKKDQLPELRMTAQLEKMDLVNSLSFTQSSPAQVNKKENEPVPGFVKGSVLTPVDSITKAIETVAVIPKVQKDLKPMLIPEQKKKMPPAVSIPVIKAAPKTIPRLVAADIALRKTEVIRQVFFQSDSLVLSLYDNGQVDGDTVSVVVNDKVVIARQGLKTTAITTTFYPDATADSLRLIMYAENLGSIPPNTGLLVIQDGSERYEIRFEGDLQRNSAVILKRKR